MRSSLCVCFIFDFLSNSGVSALALPPPFTPQKKGVIFCQEKTKASGNLKYEVVTGNLKFEVVG